MPRALLALFLTIALGLSLLFAQVGHAARPSIALPIVVDRPPVLVRAEAGLDDQAALVAAVAPATLAGLARDLDGLAQATRVEIRLVRRAEDLPGVAPPDRGVPSYADAVHWPGTGTVALAARGRSGDLVDLTRVLRHELAHLALDRALAPKDARVPRWLTEGFAGLHAHEISAERAWGLFSALLGGHVIPIWDLETRFPAREDEVHLAYAQAYDFVGFLARRGRHPDERPEERRWAFQRFLSELARGQSLDDAARTAWLRSLAQLESEWLIQLRERYFWMPIGLLGTFVWASAGILLTLAWARRRRQKRVRLAAMAIAESREIPEMSLFPAPPFPPAPPPPPPPTLLN